MHIIYNAYNAYITEFQALYSACVKLQLKLCPLITHVGTALLRTSIYTDNNVQHLIITIAIVEIRQRYHNVI